jgi:hypothetical protein
VTGEDEAKRDGGDACRGLTAAEIASFLDDAATGMGNFRLGRASARVAQALGIAWVAAGARSIRKQGLGFDVEISADGLRQYRSPSYKPNQRRIQANYDRRERSAGDWQHRGHLDIDATCP